MFRLSMFFLLVLASVAGAQTVPVKHASPPPIYAEKGVIVSPFNANDLRYPRGLNATPRVKLLTAQRFNKAGIKTPSQVLMLPKQLSMWGNDQYGDCVSASEAARKAAYSVYCGLPETFIPEATVISWARKYGYLNGADLIEVMEQAAKNPMVASDGKSYFDGPYTAVNFSDEAELQAAIAVGPVNLGIDANALPSGAGNKSAWYAFGGRPGQFNNEDHCVALFGFGPTAALFQGLNATYGVNVSPPAGAPASGYLLFTWSTVGVVDHNWIMSTVGEAWVQHPQTVGQMPGPAPTPIPPIPPTPGGKGTLIMQFPGMKDQAWFFDYPGAGKTVPDSTPQELIDVLNKIYKAKVEPKSSKIEKVEKDIGRILKILEGQQANIREQGQIIERIQGKMEPYQREEPIRRLGESTAEFVDRRIKWIQGE